MNFNKVESEMTKGGQLNVEDDYDKMFQEIDSMNFEAFDFNSIDLNESYAVGYDDYSIIMSSKKKSQAAVVDSWSMAAKGGHVTPGAMITPGGEEEKRDYEQEADFLGSIFENFERSVIDQVLKEKPSLDAAYKHLEEFLDFNFDSDGEDDEEEEKHAAAASH